jgi:hypothetical protein
MHFGGLGGVLPNFSCSRKALGSLFFPIGIIVLGSASCFCYRPSYSILPSDRAWIKVGRSTLTYRVMSPLVII